MDTAQGRWACYQQTMPEKTLLSVDYSNRTDASGDSITVIDVLTTPRASLTGHDRHILHTSASDTVIARPNSHDLYAHGDTQLLARPTSPLVTR
jgi:hypothetical protein